MCSLNVTGREKALSCALSKHTIMSPVKPETKAQVCEGKYREKDLATCKSEGEEKQDCIRLLVFTFPPYNTGNDVKKAPLTEEEMQRVREGFSLVRLICGAG